MTLTPQQAAQVKAAPPKERAAKTAMYNERNRLRLKQRKPAAPKALAKRMPQAARPRQTQPGPRASFRYAFNGFDKRHMPLDEVTAPYTVSNFETIMEFQSKVNVGQVIVVCQRSHQVQQSYIGPDSDYIAMMYDDTETIDGSIPVTKFARSPIIGAPERIATGQEYSIRARLHNLSAKLECLGTNTGLYPPGSVYIGKVPCIETGTTSQGAKEGLTIKQAWADDSIQVGYLKSYPAVSLISHPVCVDSTVAENISYKSWSDLGVPASGTDLGSMSFKTALEPIVLYIPKCGKDTTAVDYRLVLGQQWCSRHPHNVIVRATQKQHGSTPPDTWHKVVAAAKDVGPKLLDQVSDTAVQFVGARMRQAAYSAIA